MFVAVEPDDSGEGWHIWLTERHPHSGRSDGYDVWADDVEDAESWLEDEFRVRWIE
jgi:hypothetical protein